MDSQNELDPKARELAERVIAIGRTSRISPDAQRAMHIGGSGRGKTSALAVVRAQLDASGVPYEESEDEAGHIALRFRPAGAEPTSTEE